MPAHDPQPTNQPANPHNPHRRAFPTDTPDGMLLIISGPSGVGKTSITRGVERSIADSVFSVSATTRPKTDADVEGVDYHFVTDAEFERMRAAREFLESAEVFGRKYGTPRRWVEEQLARGRLVILEIDVQGARQVKGAMPEAFGLFVLPPSEDALLERSAPQAGTGGGDPSAVRRGPAGDRRRPRQRGLRPFHRERRPPRRDHPGRRGRAGRTRRTHRISEPALTPGPYR